MEQKEYIERDAALNIAFEWCPDDDGSVGKTGDLRDMLDELEAIPAADVRPVVRGRWVAADFHTVKCSICGFEMDIMKVDDHILNHANYCPNCGADMRKEKP